MCDKKKSRPPGKDRCSRPRSAGRRPRRTRRPADRPPPAAARGQQVDHPGQDQGLTDLGEQWPRCPSTMPPRRPPPPGPRPPEQDGQAGHDQGLEPRSGMIACSSGSGRRPAGGAMASAASQPGHAAADQQHVDDHGHGQSEQVLDGGDRIEIGHEQDRPQRSLVADRVHSLGVVQVPGGVDIEQRGPVGDLGQHPERQAGGQQDDGQPVPPREPGPCGVPPGRAAILGPACRDRSAVMCPGRRGRRWTGRGRGGP